MKFAAVIIILAAALSFCAAGELDNHRITVDLQDADLSAALRMMFSQTGVSYVLGEDVHGLVTAHLENLPLSDALRAILSPRGFVAAKYGDTYTIRRKTAVAGDPNQPTPIAARKAGETTSAIKTSSAVIEKIPLKYIDAYELAAVIQGAQNAQTQPREYHAAVGWNSGIPYGQFGQQLNLGCYPQWNYGSQTYTNPWRHNSFLQPTANPNSRFDTYNQSGQRKWPLLND